MLIEQTLYGTVNKVKIAIARLRLHEPPEGYYLAFSGGKDSCVCYDLCRRAGVKFDAHYAVTTVDPPELVNFIRKEYPDAWEGRERPAMSMWELITHKGILPTRKVRYCCQVLKEGHGKGRMVITGIRAAESPRRAKRAIMEACQTKRGKGFIHPIINWTTAEVWEYIKRYDISYCGLYDESFKRLGCIGCPFASTEDRNREFARWPKYKEFYLTAIRRMREKRKKRGQKLICSTAEEEFDWWLTGKTADYGHDENQTTLFGVVGDESML